MHTNKSVIVWTLHKDEKSFYYAVLSNTLAISSDKQRENAPVKIDFSGNDDDDDEINFNAFRDLTPAHTKPIARRVMGS